MARPKKDEAAELKRKQAKTKRLEQAKLNKVEIKPVKPLTIEQRIDRLEFIVRKMAHFKGVQKIVTEAGLEPWLPGHKDMTKWKSEVKD